MGYTLFTVRLAEMLLISVDSQTLGRLYEKAPKKKMPIIAKQIPDRIRAKTINNLLDRGNLTYTISQINDGRLDRFYRYEGDNNTETASYKSLQELMARHDTNAGQVLLGLIKKQDDKAIEAFFESDINNIELLHEDWAKIDWATNKETPVNSSAERQLTADKSKMIKANAKLKEKLNQAETERKQSKEAHKEEIDKLTKQFQQQLSLQKKNASEALNEALNELRNKSKSEQANVEIISKKETETLKLRIEKLESALSQESARVHRYHSILRDIASVNSGKFTIVASEPFTISVPTDYVFIGKTSSVEELKEWVRLLKPAKLVLIQEITPRNEWLTLMKTIQKEELSTKVVFISKYELTEEKK